MNSNCTVKHFRLNNIDPFLHSGTEINKNSVIKVNCATVRCPGQILMPQTACSWFVWISQWLNHRLQLSRPDKRKLHPCVLISWELPGFASHHTDEGCSIERLYQGIKKKGLKSQDVKACFAHNLALGLALLDKTWTAHWLLGWLMCQSVGHWWEMYYHLPTRWEQNS